MDILLIKAIHFAAFKHRNQRRKDAELTPYINHPLELLNILVVEGGVTDVAVLCGAVLHDTIEDTNTNYDELLGLFGKEVADIVMDMTDDKALSKQERKDKQVATAPHLSPKSKLVKLADKIANVRDIGDHPPESWATLRRQKYLVWANSVVEGLRGIHPGLELAFDRAKAQSQEKIEATY